MQKIVDALRKKNSSIRGLKWELFLINADVRRNHYLVRFNDASTLLRRIKKLSKFASNELSPDKYPKEVRELLQPIKAEHAKRMVRYGGRRNVNQMQVAIEIELEHLNELIKSLKIKKK